MTATDIHGCHWWPNDRQLAAPADDERGEGDQRHGLATGSRTAAGRARPGGSAASGWRGRGRRRRRSRSRPWPRRNVYHVAREHDLADGAARPPQLGLAEAAEHVPHVRHRQVVGAGRQVERPDAVVRRPGRAPCSPPRAATSSSDAEHARAAPAAPAASSAVDAPLGLGRHVVGDGGDDVLAVRGQRLVLAVVLQVDGELVDAEVLQLLQPLDVRARPDRGCRSGRRSRRARTSVCVLPAWPCSL